MTLSVRLCHRLGDFRLDAAFEAPAGVTALFGRSGSGKTTIVNAVAGLLRPDAGRIATEDAVLVDSDRGILVPPHRRRVGYVFQDARLFPHLSVGRNLTYGRAFARDAGGPDPAHIAALLGISDLLARRPGALSGGERQRVALGRAILSNPRLLLMDEPLAALDEARKAEILPYLERLRDEIGLPILYVSHSVAEIARLATTVVLIDAGRVTATGPAVAILSDFATLPALGLREAGAILDARLVRHDDDGLSRLATSAGPLFLPRLDADPGAAIRLRILAQDVMIALERPVGLSALNILPARVLDLQDSEGAGVMVRLGIGGQTLLSRITRRSAQTLGLCPGLPVHAVLKAVSVAREAIGHGAGAG